MYNSTGIRLPSRFSKARAQQALSIGVLLLVLASGCVNTLAIMSKVFVGDPKQPSGFQLATGKSLEKSDKQVLLYCSALPLVTDAHGALPGDIQEQLSRRMKRHEIQLVHADAGTDVIDRLGEFNADAIGAEVPGVDYIMHIQLDTFSLTEPNSPDLYRSRSSGTVTGYEVRQEEDGTKLVVQVFEHNFSTEYPPSQPVPREQTPKNVFERRAIDFLADSLGASFYEVYMSELYAR